MSTPFFTPKEVWPAPGPERTPEAAPDELVLFSVRITRADYMRLKEAVYWGPGLTEQEVVQDALRAKMDALGADIVKPLPAAKLAKLLKTNKKLKSQGTR